MDQKVRFMKSRTGKIGLAALWIMMTAVFPAVWAEGELKTQAPAAKLPNPSEVITPEELRDLQLKAVDFILWDARNKGNYEESHIQGATLPLPDAFYNQTELFAKGLSPNRPDPVVALQEAVRDIGREKQIVTYCSRNCPASHTLLVQLKTLGFINVRSMEVGIQAWQEKGYPVVIGAPKLRSE